MNAEKVAAHEQLLRKQRNKQAKLSAFAAARDREDRQARNRKWVYDVSPDGDLTSFTSSRTFPAMPAMPRDPFGPSRSDTKIHAVVQVRRQAPLNTDTGGSARQVAKKVQRAQRADADPDTASTGLRRLWRRPSRAVVVGSAGVVVATTTVAVATSGPIPEAAVTIGVTVLMFSWVFSLVNSAIARGAASAAPASEGVTIAELESARFERRRVAGAYADYQIDPIMAFRFPALNDVRVPETAELVAALLAVATYDESDVTELTEAQRVDFVDRVSNLSTCWDVAETKARHIGLDSMPFEMRNDVERAIKMLTKALDSAVGDEERSAFIVGAIRIAEFAIASSSIVLPELMLEQLPQVARHKIAAVVVRTQLPAGQTTN